MQSQELSSLVEQALTANPSLQKSRLAVESSTWSAKQAGSGQLPTASASLSATEDDGTSTTYKAGINVSWEIDIWQRLADSSAAADVSLAMEKLTYDGARASLVGNVMKRWLGLVAANRAYSIQQQRLELLEKNEKLIIARYRNGLGTLSGLDNARTQTSQAKATLAEYAEEIAIQERALALLLGRNSLSKPLIAAAYPPVILPIVALPEQNLEQRPDIQAARLAIKAADLNADATFKNRLPSFSLSAALSDSGTSFSDALFVSPIWSLVAQLSAPIYEGGKRKAQSEIANIAVAQRYQEYRDTLLTAVNEINNSVGQEKVLSARIVHTTSAIATAESDLRLTEQQYRSGLSSLTDLINAQQTLFDLQAQLDTLHYQQLSNRIDLGLALGLGIAQS